VSPHLFKAVAAAMASSLLLLACGGSDGTSPTQTIPAGAVVVKAGPGLVLDQSQYVATAQGGRVTIAYVQQDTQRHTLAIKDSAGVIVGKKLEVVKKGDIDYGTYTFEPGTYEMIYCDVPGHGTMKATLQVN